MTAFVVGATGYTGRAVVAALRRRDLPTVAHVRPDSPRLAEWRGRLEALGAEVDTTPWDEPALTERLRALGPRQVFALLGTTAKRARQEGIGDPYEQVDYGLTALLLRATVASGHRPRFVYLSAIGVSEGTRNRYMRARAKVEAELRASGLPFTIARPAFITGADREEPRLGERLGAAAGDAALAVFGALGARGLRARYRSTDAVTLAEGLVRLALDPDWAGRVAEGDALRGGGGEQGT